LVHNVRADHDASLSRGRKEERVSLLEVTGNEAGAVLQQYWAQNKITRPYFDTEEGSDLDGFLAESPRHPVFRIEGTA